MKTNYDDEFDRAQAHEEELQRKLNMSDGVSSPKPNGFTPQGANYYNSFAQGNPQSQNPYPAYPVQYRPASTAATATAGVVLKVVAVIFYFIALAMLIMMIVVVTHLRSTYAHISPSSSTPSTARHTAKKATQVQVRRSIKSAIPTPCTTTPTTPQHSMLKKATQ